MRPTYVSPLNAIPLSAADSSLQSDVIDAITTTADGQGSRLHVSFGYYSFDVGVSADYKILTVTMRNPSNNTTGPFELAAMHINPTNIPSTVAYIGRLEWLSYANNEMVTLVVPYDVAEGVFFGLYHEWTVDTNGVKKANAPVNGVFQDVKYAADGSTTAVFTAEDYTYTFTFSGTEGSFVLSDAKGDESQENKFAVTFKL